MRLILRNFVNILRCYTQSSLFNILGLSFAFAACYLITIQTSYDYGFGKVHEGYENIYRTNVKMGEEEAALGAPTIKVGLDKSSSVVASTIINAFPSTGISAELNGEMIAVDTEILGIDSSANSVLEFDMVMGEFSAIGNPNSVIIPLSIAENIYGNAENSIGKKISCKSLDATYDVVAVYKDFSKRAVLQNKIFVFSDIDYGKPFDGFGCYIYFKVADGININELEKTISNKVSVLFKKVLGDISISFTALKDTYFERDLQYIPHPTGNKSISLTLVLVAILIMVIAIINFVNFSIALAPRRIKAINTYRILGHSLTGLRFMLVFEAVFISVVSLLLSIGFIELISDTTFANVFSSSVMVVDNINTLILMGGFAVVVGLIAGIYPAFHITNFSPALVLNGGKSLPKSALLIRQILISFQYVISITMIIIAVFINLQNNFMMNKDYGYNIENLLEVKVSSSRDEIIEELSNFSFIEDITFSANSIISGNQYNGWAIDGDDIGGSMFKGFFVNYNYAEVMGLEIIEGEDFVEEDTKGKGRYILFNESAKKRYNLTLGQKIDHQGRIIKGFFKDVNHESLHKAVEPLGILVSDWDWLRIITIKYIGDDNIGNVVDAVRKVVAEINDGEVAKISTADQLRYETYKKDANLNMIISWAAMLAILISIIGVVGLISLESQHRIREIALRKVHGATTLEILKMFNSKFIKVVAICYVISVPLAWWIVDMWLQGFEYRVAMSAWVFVVAGVFIAGLTIFIVTAQSYKAATTNPANAMK